MLKHHMSVVLPPGRRSHATLVASVTLCARKLGVGSEPQMGVLLQYITGGGRRCRLDVQRIRRTGDVQKRVGWSTVGVRAT